MGSDIIADETSAGHPSFDLDFELLSRKGTLVSIGNASGAVEPMAPLRLVTKNLKLLRPTVGNYIVTPEESYTYGTQLFNYIADGTLKINIWKTYAFTAEGVKEAQKDLTGGQTSGKLVIRVADD
jgi:NADPH:quinone reductase